MIIRLSNRVETFVANGEIVHDEQFLLLPPWFQSHLLNMCQKASVCGKWLTLFQKVNIFHGLLSSFKKSTYPVNIVHGLIYFLLSKSQFLKLICSRFTLKRLLISNCMKELNAKIVCLDHEDLWTSNEISSLMKTTQTEFLISNNFLSYMLQR